MGNALSPCLAGGCRSDREMTIKVLLWGGATRTFPAASPHCVVAGALLAEFPAHEICHAGSFYIGRPIPKLFPEDELAPGETYLLVPADRIPPCGVLTASSVALLVAGPDARSPRASPFGEGGINPFERVKTEQGETQIKISMDFLMMAAARGSAGEERKCAAANEDSPVLCSTPELRKHYDQLVGPRSSPWSPKLDTILECKCIKPSGSPVRMWPLRRASWTSRGSSKQIS